MALSFFNLRKECYNFNHEITNPLLKEAYELFLIMETEDIYCSYFCIDGESRKFVTLKNPYVLFCTPFAYEDVEFNFQISIKKLSFDIYGCFPHVRRKTKPKLQLRPDIIELKDYDIFDRIEEGFITFDEIHINDIDFVKRTRLDKAIDANGRNILFCTADDPELTIEIIKVLGVEFQVDTFDRLPVEIINRYYDFGLHKITDYLPKNYFQSDIADISDRFENGDIELFIEDPNLLRFLKLEDFRDVNFFDRVCLLSDSKIYDGKYAIDVAIYFGHCNKIFEINLYPDFEIGKCENWDLLDDDIIIYFLTKNF